MLGFFVQLWMYATPVIYPISTITNAKLKLLMMANPITWVIEAYKHGMLGAGSFLCVWGGGYSAGFATALKAIGIVMFNLAQRSFIDMV